MGDGEANYVGAEVETEGSWVCSICRMSDRPAYVIERIETPSERIIRALCVTCADRVGTLLVEATKNAERMIREDHRARGISAPGRAERS